MNLSKSKPSDQDYKAVKFNLISSNQDIHNILKIYKQQNCFPIL